MLLLLLVMGVLLLFLLPLLMLLLCPKQVLLPIRILMQALLQALPLPLLLFQLCLKAQQLLQTATPPLEGVTEAAASAELCCSCC